MAAQDVIVGSPGHAAQIAGRFAGSLAEAAQITYLNQLAVKLEAAPLAPYWADGLYDEAPGIVQGRIPMVISDDRWRVHTGNAKFSGMTMKFRDVTISAYFRGRKMSYLDWMALGQLGNLVFDLSGESETDAALVPQLLGELLTNGASVTDFDGQPMFAAANKLFNPIDSSFGTYGNLLTGDVTEANINAGLNALYTRMSLQGLPLKLWQYPIDLVVPLSRFNTARDIVEYAELIPKPGLKVAGGGDANDLNTGGNTNTIQKKGLRVVVGEFTPPGEWYLVSRAPSVKPFVVATPPDPVKEVMHDWGSLPTDNQLMMEAGFYRFVGVAWRTSAGIQKFTYTP
jgi:hypothetical protein